MKAFAVAERYSARSNTAGTHPLPDSSQTTHLQFTKILSVGKAITYVVALP
jgi:hypothetical protein